MTDHAFQASANPARAGSCERCGRLLDAHKPAVPPLSRDRRLEHTFIGEALEWAQRMGWPLGGRWARAVSQRLELGDQEYGTLALTRDNLPDILEETPDLGAWPLLELQRLILTGADTLPEDRMDLLAIAAHGAAADYYATRIARRRQGIDD